MMDHFSIFDINLDSPERKNYHLQIYNTLQKMHKYKVNLTIFEITYA